VVIACEGDNLKESEEEKRKIFQRKKRNMTARQGKDVGQKDNNIGTNSGQKVEKALRLPNGGVDADLKQDTGIPVGTCRSNSRREKLRMGRHGCSIFDEKTQWNLKRRTCPKKGGGERDDAATMN